MGLFLSRFTKITCFNFSLKKLIQKYYTKLNLDFHTNKRIIEEVALIPSKPLRNKIAGFITHLMKGLQRSTVRGISIKLQEEERERGITTSPMFLLWSKTSLKSTLRPRTC